MSILPNSKNLMGLNKKKRVLAPVCGGETYHGYGMLGGGMGMYIDCGSCDWFYKWQDEE